MYTPPRHSILFVILLLTGSLSGSWEDEPPPSKLINIESVEGHCETNGICRNFHFPNNSEIAFFELKPHVRILDAITFNYESSLQSDTLIFENSTFAHFPLHFFYSIGVVRELDMRNCSIETITWENFLMAESLRVLLLSQNRLHTITEMTFNYASDLRYLFLDSNRLRTLVNESFKGLTRLSYLNLSANRLRDLPVDVFSYLPKLNELNLAGNRLRYLPRELFAHNSELSAVILRDNELRTLDEYLFRNQRGGNLILIDLANNVQLSRLIMNLQTKFLIASNCSLYLVNLYGQVRNADLHDNQIVELYFAQPESLETLVLQNNALQQIASLTRAINLRELNLSDNPGLEYLPETWTVNSLERLDLSNTSLRTLPISQLAEQTNLRVLNVSNNKIANINPSNYKYLEKLTHFYIDANDWNCYNLRLLMDLLIQPQRIVYRHDRFDADFPGEYIEGIACMYRIEEDDDENENEENSSENGLMQLILQETSSIEPINNEYPTDDDDNNDRLLRRELESLRRELKAIVAFYESKFDKVMSDLKDMNERVAAFERLNETLLEHITIVT